jgi:carboxymethylenebutenolidase
MIVLPDVRGLHTYYKELALRFAENGIDAIAIDYFARTDQAGDRGEGFDYLPHVKQTAFETVQADIAAAVAYLRSPDGGAVRSLFSVGFCFGGALSSLQAASGLGYAGVVSFYGWPLGLPIPVDVPKPIESADRFGCPVLAIYGGADQGIPPDAIQQFDRALDGAGVAHETHVYEGAPHSFFDRTQAQHAEASADAWQRVLSFVRAHTTDA